MLETRLLKVKYCWRQDYSRPCNAGDNFTRRPSNSGDNVTEGQVMSDTRLLKAE